MEPRDGLPSRPVPPSRPHFKGDFKNPVKGLFLVFLLSAALSHPKDQRHCADLTGAHGLLQSPPDGLWLNRLSPTWGRPGLTSDHGRATSGHVERDR
jgi:hypothetical protein